jgi:hypothetical protein
MAIASFFMTILSVPALILSFNGKRILRQDYDAIGLYRFTVGEYDGHGNNYHCILYLHLIISLLINTQNYSCLH